jgi:glycosyltransferase involved in cell wall biosynthesis
MRLTLLVTTYERPDALARVLETVAWQTVPPNEVLIADDGSGAPTRTVIDSFARHAASPVIHSWQPHEGFRVCRSRNRALARANGDYVVQIDGDMLLHPEFIADHRWAARPRSFVQGTRILLSEAATRDALASGPRVLEPLDAGMPGLRRAYAVRSRRLSRLFMHAANAFIAVKGCNQGYWLADALHVNGYDEAMTGWGSEDKEFAARLEHAGLRRRTVLFGAIAWHLHHAPASRERHGNNNAILARTRRQRAVRCADGIQKL